MQIVPYTNSESKAVAILFRNIFREMGWEERASDFMDTPHILFHIPHGGTLILAKENDKVVGTAGLILLTDAEGLIKRFYLEKTYRGTGIARKLLKSLVKNAKFLGVTKLILDVSKNNLRAIGFYKKNGFQQTTVTPHDGWQESHEPETHYYFYKRI